MRISESLCKRVECYIILEFMRNLPATPYLTRKIFLYSNTKTFVIHRFDRDFL